MFRDFIDKSILMEVKMVEALRRDERKGEARDVW
jgi:hypothetical protein